ncbi:Rha family transcriptional regulator [Bartonella taylorii]|uniref:Rha family transcriptional regulator n=1 Tax=Bartonella taylorii TaxID=33046 RepID=UPI001ABA9AB9|nr:hypothetical protein [Bartonella taylorii]
MNSLVTINNDGIAVTTSLKIAEGVGNNHATVIKLVRQNIEDFEEFGRVGFEILPFKTAKHKDFGSLAFQMRVNSKG